MRKSERSTQIPLHRNRNFLLLLSGQFVSWTGTEVSGITIPLVVLALTGSALQAGIIAGIRGWVYVIWSIPAGVAVDRYDRRVVMVVSNLGSGIAMGSIALALIMKDLTITQLYIAGAVEGTFFVFANLARFAVLPRVVSKDQVPAASAQVSVAGSTSLSIGPPLGGIMYQTLGAVFSFAFDSLSYLFNAISIFFITVPLQIERKAEKKHPLHEIKEGAIWLWSQKTYVFLTILISTGTMVSAGLYLLIVIIAKSLGASAGTIGLVLAVGASGGILGAFFSNKIQKRLAFGQILILTTTLSFLLFVCYLFAVDLVILAIISFTINTINPIYEVTSYSYTASITPDEIRGKVLSITRTITLSAYSLGFFIMGSLLQFKGVTYSILIFSLILLALAILTITNKSIKSVHLA